RFSGACLAYQEDKLALANFKVDIFRNRVVALENARVFYFYYGFIGKHHLGFCPGKALRRHLFGSAGVDFLVVGQEFFESAVSQGMLQQSCDNAQRTSCYICADFSTLDEVDGMSNGGSKNFCIEGVVVVDLPDLGDQLNTVL